MAGSSQSAAKLWVLVLASCASFMVSLDSQVVLTALTTIRADFDTSLETLEWTVNAYILTFAVLLLAGSALGDRFGRRRMFVLGFGLFSLHSPQGFSHGFTAAMSLAAALSLAGSLAAISLPARRRTVLGAAKQQA